MWHIFKYILNLFYRVDNSDGSLLNRVLYLSESVCNFSELSDISLLFPKLDAAMIKYLIVLCPRTVYGGVLMEQ